MNRILQPSTWAGIAAIFQVAKSFFPQYATYVDIITTAAGSLAVALNEKGKAQ
jgi:hypothetical protein